MNLTEISDKIQEKLGKEESGKIADDIANILIYEESNNKILQEKDSEISKLKQDKEMLIQANGNLLLKVPQGREETPEIEKEKDPRDFDFRTVFENGKFKR